MNKFKSLALHTDLYQLTMIQGYYLCQKNEEAVFDMFFRKAPFQGGYSVFAGLEPLVDFITNYRFSPEDISYLKGLGLFQDSFLDYLKEFRFAGNLYSVEEGQIVFPNEPIMRVHANLIEAQLLETILLNIVNFQTLIATKSARICEAARNKPVLEFGLRRAHGLNGGFSASRASFIGGCASTSNVLAGKELGIPTAGTMAHSWIMAFGSEEESYQQYADFYPEHTTLLVDTYNTLEKGIPAAIPVLRKLKEKGIKHFGIRIDSGDLEYLSKEARKMLDHAGLAETQIIASNDLDEYIVEELMNKNSPIDLFGVGTSIATGKGESALAGVYKLAARKQGKEIIPCIKVSNNPDKTTNPHIKNILRLYDKDLMLGDLIFIEEEKSDIEKKLEKKLPFTFLHPSLPYETSEISNYLSGEILLKEIIRNGKPCYSFPSLSESRTKTKENLLRLHHSYKRLLNPHVYKVSLTPKLSALKIKMIKEHK